MSRLTQSLETQFTDGGKVSLISVRGGVVPRVTVRLERLDRLNNAKNTSGIESTTFMFVAIINTISILMTGIIMDDIK
jgi:hypothetical protein